MEIRRVHRLNAVDARGIVVVIDVIRAFSVAAYALAGGARGLWLVGSVEEAQALRARQPDALLAGEVGGRLIAGFDFNNSPSRMAEADVRGRLLMQRTGAGTRGAVDATGARYLLACALVNARATAAYAGMLAEATGEPLTLMPTAFTAYEGANAFEDELCADYLEALLAARSDAREALDDGIARLRAAGRFQMFEAGSSDFPADDVPAFLAVDRFAFAMPGVREKWQDITYVNVSRLDMDGSSPKSAHQTAP
jgi:2-phosphosulfolactate phosphatase